MTDEEQGFSLLMPFVVCRSQGGPYEDSAFVAGAAFGQHAEELRRTQADDWQAYVAPQMVPQYDLLAMHEGHQMTCEPWNEHPDEWVLVRFKRPSDPSGGGHSDG